MTVLVVEGLACGYARPCVRDIEMSVQAGEIVAVLGPNGAGKTTLLATLAGLLPRLGGSVRVGGRELRSGDPRAAVKAGVVLVPDDRSLFPGLSAADHFRLAGGRAAAEPILEYFPALRARLDVAAGMLSGGEQQMLAIGRALAQSPAVLLIDELSMGLAPVIVQALLPVLRQVAADTGTAIVLVEQHVAMALAASTSAMVLAHGDVVLSGRSGELARRDVERAYLGETAPAAG